MNPVLHELHKKQLIWRAASTQAIEARLCTSYDKLDKALNGGFPQAGLVHIKSLIGLGEMRLILPSLKKKNTKQLYAFIAPPYRLNPEFLISNKLTLEDTILIESQECSTRTDETLWSAEQCAKSGACDAIFLWHNKLSTTQAKKLECAAIRGQCLLFVFESKPSLNSNLPVSLAMSLQRDTQTHTELEITINKQKVGWPIPSFNIQMSFVTKMGSPMNKGQRASYQAANIHVLHRQ